jgi:hypothetical protein
MEEQHNTTEKILAAIENKQVTPRPKWYFILRNSILWIPGLVTTFLGAYTVAGVLYGIAHAHLENRLYSDHASQIIFSIAIPVLWVVSFILFSLVTLSLVRKTNNGYRHTALELISISVACSIVIGVLFYAFTASSLSGPGMLYRYPTQHQQESIWNNPNNGRISGIIDSSNNGIVTMTDFNGSIWNININAIPQNEDSIIKIGTAIRVVGVVTAHDTFAACRILPWEIFPMQAGGVVVPVAIHKEPISCDTLLSRYNQ